MTRTPTPSPEAVEIAARNKAALKRLDDLKAVHSRWSDGKIVASEAVREMESIAYSVHMYLAGIDGPYMAEAREEAALHAAGWTLVPPGEEGKVAVPTEALRWLMGMGESFDRPEGVRGAFWWRSEFLRRANLDLFDLHAPPRSAAKEI